MPQLIQIPRLLARRDNRKRFSEADCEFLERSGLLDENYELIDGDIITKMPQKNPHRIAVIRLIAWLTSIFPPDLAGTQATIRIDATNLPEPDGFVLYRLVPVGQNYPEAADVRFVVEVSDTTLAEDIGIKAGIYSRAGIAEYWVVDIASRRIIAHRQPSETGYAEMFACDESEDLAPLFPSESAIRVANLLPPAALPENT